MPRSILTSAFMFCFLWGATFLLGVALLNTLLFNMNRSVLKKVLKVGDGVISVLLPPVVLILFRRTDLVSQVLSLAPQSPAAWSIILLATLVWTSAITCQSVFLLRRFRPRPIGAIGEIQTRVAPYHPNARDWEILREADNAPHPPLKSGAAPPPPQRRRRIRIPQNSWIPRSILSWPLRAIDRSYHLHVNDIVLQFPNLPAPFEGFRILQLSDSHYGALMSPAYYRHVIDEARQIPADLIVLTGDFTADDYLYHESVELFAPLSAPLGVWAVRGNHDYYTEPHLIAYWLEHFGIRLLSNRFVDFEREGEILRLAGTEHPYETVRDWQSVTGKPGDSGPFCITLTHKPDNIVYLSRVGCNFALAGHTHGGQWRLPAIGPLFIPSIYGRRFDEGFQQVGSSLLYISHGFGGHTFPLRLNCPPEITLFTLRRRSTESFKA